MPDTKANTNKRYWKITPIGDKCSCYVEEGDIEAIGSWLEGMTTGYGLTVEVVEMSETKFNQMPEYEG